jgi:hypothetical protein
VNGETAPVNEAATLHYVGRTAAMPSARAKVRG